MKCRFSHSFADKMSQDDNVRGWNVAGWNVGIPFRVIGFVSVIIYKQTVGNCVVHSWMFCIF